MPIYEFYCADCHTIYNFFSRRINTETTPACPRCGRKKLERQVSLFSLSKGRKDEGEAGEDLLDNIDESKLERAMASMASEMEGMDDDDPKAAAQMMRRLFNATGMNLSGSMEEAIRRMESGEDPEKIEEEMGDVLEQEDPFAAKPKRVFNDLRRRLLPPRVDETLYDL